MIPLKSPEDLAKLKRSGAILAAVMRKLQEKLQSGMTTLDIDLLSEGLIRQEHALAAFKGYRGFPGTPRNRFCTDVLTHARPDHRRRPWPAPGIGGRVAAGADRLPD